MYCINCGKENEDTAQACVACGESFVKKETLGNVGAVPSTENQKVSSELPPELNKFNWGAFILTWIWGVGHGVWVALLIIAIDFGMRIIGAAVIFWGGEIGALVTLLIVLLGMGGELGFALWLGLKGNKLAWKTGRYNDVEKFKATEKKWAIVGLILFLVGLLMIVPILMMIVIGATHGARDKADEARNRAVATRIQARLEDYYGGFVAYCGDTYQNQNRCGTYSFLEIANQLEAGVIYTDSDCEGGLSGGGTVTVEKDKYTITAYDGLCKRPIPGAELHQK